MSLQKRYLILLICSVVPQLHGCLWESLHVEGNLDAKGRAEEVSSKDEASLKSEDDTNEDSKE